MNGAKKRVAASLLSISVAGFASWAGYEGFSTNPIIPVAGDVPTIGHGSTRYEDGRRVRMDDPPISRERAEQLAKNLIKADERQFHKSIPGVKLNQQEYDVYIDFIGQYGIGSWNRSSARRHLLAGEYTKACDALLMWRYAGGYDCSTTVNGRPNNRCWGVWKRQKERHSKCLEAQHE